MGTRHAGNLHAVLPDDTHGRRDGHGGERRKVSGEVMAMSSEPIDIDDLRKRHANSILNTATGRALGAALDELEELRRPETTAEITERLAERLGLTQPVVGHRGLRDCCDLVFTVSEFNLNERRKRCR